MDLFLKLDEYLSKPLEGMKSRISKSFNAKILEYGADKNFCMDEISRELRNSAQEAYNFYKNWLIIFRDSPGFFVEHNKLSDFLKINDNIRDKGGAIIGSFERDIWRMLDRKMKMEKMAEVGRDTLVGWISEIGFLTFL